MELEAGKLDVVFLDYMTVLSYADAKEDLAAVDLGIPETSDGYSIAVKKGNTELAEFINGVLAELKEQNTIRAVHRRGQEAGKRGGVTPESTIQI